MKPHGPAGRASLAPWTFRRWALLIFGIAIAVRLVHVWQLRASPFFSILIGDSRGYDQWARELAAGNWIGDEVFYQAPLYPYFLGAVYWLFGRDLLSVRVVQAALGAGACVLLALATARLFSARAGLIAGLMLALYAPAIFFDALIQKSILDVFFICLILWLVSELVSQPHRSALWFALGAAFGGLTLTRENALLLAVVAVAWAAANDRTASHMKSGSWVLRTRTAAIVAGLALVLLPVAARNAAVGGAFFLTTAQFGPNFYIGNNARADGTYAALREGRGDPLYERQDATALAEQALGRRLSPSEVSAFWRDRALQYILSQPGHWLKLVVRKFMLLISATEMIDTEAQESHAEWSSPLRWAGGVWHFGMLLPLALVGVVVTWQQRKRLWILYALSAVYALSVVAFFVVARYRYPLVPFAVLFASVGLSQLPAFVREAPRTQLVTVTAAVIVVAVLAQRPVLSGDAMRAITETNLGVALHDESRFDEATLHYRRALQIEPDYAPAYNSLGVALRALGRLDEAIASYRQAVAKRPDYAEAHYNLATALLEHRKPHEALAHFEIARRSLPMTAGAHNNLGVALASAGRRDEAIAQFQAALALQPDAPVTLRNLGEASARLQRYPEAIAYFRKVVELDAGSATARYDLGNVLLEAGRLREAETELRQAIRLAPSPQAHSGLGVALAAQGSIDEAIAEFRQALTLQPDFAPAQRYLAMALASRR